MKDLVIIGAGGLGSPAAWQFAETYKESYFNVKIIDGDLIELSNLNRQVLFSEKDIGNFKAEILVSRLKLINNNINFYSQTEFLAEKNIDLLLENSCFVIDACDDVKTKFLINDYCVKNKIPFCYAGVLGYFGQAFLVSPGETACLRCLFGNDADIALKEEAESCHQAGIAGPVAGSLGTLQAELAHRYLLGEKTNCNILFRCNFENLSFSKLPLTPSSECLLGCGSKKKLLDLTSVNCPTTFLYTKLALEELPNSYNLEVKFSNINSFKNVLNSIIEEGFKVLESDIEKLFFIIKKDATN